MPPKPSTTAPKTTRAENRRNGNSILNDNQDIKGATEGRKYLEEHSLLCPPGEPTTPTSLSVCLHQISMMSGISKQAINAIRSVAFLIEEMEETTINETIRDAFESQVTEFTSDMKLLIEDAKEKIDTHLKNATVTFNNQNYNPTQPNRTNTGSYAAALISPPPTVNPILAAREGIKARQILLEGMRESTLSHLDTIQLKKELNRILEELGMEGGKIRSVQNQRDGRTLVEMDNDAAANWIKSQDNANKFCAKIGAKTTVKLRQYNIIAFNVPTDMDTDNPRHKAEISETNGLNEDDIVSLRWAKPANRRNPGQRTAHLIITTSDVEVANRAITKGMYICSKSCRVERVKREPPRCLKCQGWNHFAKECTVEIEVCGNCSNNHRTNECPNPHIRRCASCKSSDHASWDRGCPEFVKRLSDFNKRNPENSLHFFPTTETWTWSTNENTIKQTAPRENEKGRHEPSGWPRQTSYTRRTDTYIPGRESYKPGHGHDTYVPERDKVRRPNETGSEARWGDQPPPPSSSLPPAVQQAINDASKSAPRFDNAPTMGF